MFKNILIIQRNVMVAADVSDFIWTPLKFRPCYHKNYAFFKVRVFVYSSFGFVDLKHSIND